MTTEPGQAYHESVMPKEVLDGLAVRTGRSYIDCTLGDGGHSIGIMEAAAPGGRLLGMDADPSAVAFSRQRLAPYGSAAVVVHANFAALESVAVSYGFQPAHGLLFDLGLSSRQLAVDARGFSFQRDATPDMRFDPSSGMTAAELLNRSTERELADLIFQLGEEPRSRRIARAIVANRPISSTHQLADVVRRSSGYRRSRVHPATRTFQALRMHVNQELPNLQSALAQSERVLDHGGRLVTIAYHSLEDRLIKTFLAKARGLRPVTKRVVRPSPEEVHRNPRSRSARMRVAERL